MVDSISSNDTRNETSNTTRLIIVEYFDKVINEIDLKAEELLMNKPAGTSDDINKTRTQFIDEIRLIKQYDLSKFDQIHAKNTDFKHQKSDLFHKYCFYIHPRHLKPFTIDPDMLGLLINTDYFICDNQIEHLKIMLGYIDILKPVQIKETNSLMYIENFYIIHQIKEALTSSDTYIINIPQSQFKCIRKIKINFPISSAYKCNFENIILDRFTNLSRLDLSRVFMEQFREGFYANNQALEYLYLNNNYIKTIQRNSLVSFRNLKILNLSENKINLIELEAFECLSTLEELDLSKNKLESVNDNLFSKLFLLKRLDLSHNKLRSIKNRSFFGLKNLEFLSLSWNNCIEEIESDAFDCLSSLKILSFMVNKYISVKLPKNLCELHIFYHTNDVLDDLRDINLKTFRVKSDNSLIEKYFFEKLSNLEELYLEKITIGIDKLPSVVKNLRKLEIISVKVKHDCHDLLENLVNLEEVYIEFNDNKLIGDDMKNIIKNLPNTNTIRSITVDGYDENKGFKLNSIRKECLAGFNNLSELSLINSSINSIEEWSFAKLNQLRSLNLSKNFIEILDENSFAGLVRLKILDLSENRIKSIHPKVFSNKNMILEDLNLADNLLEGIENDIFEELNELRILNISNNYIISISSDLFSKLSKLEMLDLSRNSIEKLDGEIFESLVGLKVLLLNECNLELVNSDTFERTANLEKLFLNGNKLNAIQDGLFESLKNLNFINLRQNQLVKFDLMQLIDLKELCYVDLAGNQIKELDKKLLSYLINTKCVRFSLSDNPFWVDEQLQTGWIEVFINKFEE